MKKLSLSIVLLALALSIFAQGGVIFAWGSNNNVTDYIPAPTESDFIAVDAGGVYAMALRSNGRVVAWGNMSSVKDNIPEGNDFIAISAGDEHALALRSNGSIAAWGNNTNGQAVPPPGVNANFVKIDAGGYHNIALRSDGSIVVWGSNSRRQITDMPSGTFIDVAAAAATCAAIRSDGSIVVWGTGWNGENNSPTGTGFVTVRGKNLHYSALRSNGTVARWGLDSHIGDALNGNYSFASAGYQGNLAITTGGTLVANGNPFWSRSVPASVQNLIAVHGVSMGFTGTNFSVALTGLMQDADGDGVADADDAYPNDPLRAFNTYFPSAAVFGTLAFEDLWPDQGDYDMNDLVIDYRFQRVLNADNQIKDIKANLKLRAVGGNRQNGFSIEFPFPLSAVQTYQGYHQGNPINMELVAAGNRSVLRVISSTADYVNVPGNGVYWNTQASQPTFAPIEFSFSITLTNAVNPATLAHLEPFNPFITINGQLGYEVHLPGMPPTTFADRSVFGTGNDTTNEATGRYYKTQTGLPWAVNIPISWKYPIEGRQISQAYLAFKPWAESSGTQHPNWYLPVPSSQIIIENIYNP